MNSEEQERFEILQMIDQILGDNELNSLMNFEKFFTYLMPKIHVYGCKFPVDFENHLPLFISHCKKHIRKELEFHWTKNVHLRHQLTKDIYDYVFEAEKKYKGYNPNPVQLFTEAWSNEYDDLNRKIGYETDAARKSNSKGCMLILLVLFTLGIVVFN